MSIKLEMGILSMFLALLLVGMVMMPTVSAISANTENNPGLDVTSVYRVAELSSPITLSNAKEMRESLIDNFQHRTDNHAPLLLADPVVPEGAKIVAYSFTLDARGIPIQCVGLASDRGSASIIQKKAQEWYESDTTNPQLAIAEQTGTLVGYVT